MRKNTIISLICLMAGSVAMAEGGEKRTEFFFQPGGGMHETRADFSYNSAEYEVDTGTGARLSNTVWGKTLKANYQYGLTPDWALGVGVAFGSTDQDLVPKGSAGQSQQAGSAGLGDLVLAAHNTTPMGQWNLHYGIDLNVSLGKGKLATREQEGTNMSGGYGARPYVGASMDLTGYGMIGANLGYWWKDVRKVDPQVKDYDTKIKGGDVMDIAGFYEYHGDMWLANVALGLRQTAQSKIESSNTKTGTADEPITADVSSTTFVGVGGQYYFLPTSMVRVSYEMEMRPDHTINKTAGTKELAYTNNTFSIAARYEF